MTIFTLDFACNLVIASSYHRLKLQEMIVILIFSFELFGKLNTVEALVNGHPRDTKKVSVNAAGVCFLRVLVTFQAREAQFYDFCVCIQDLSFNDFENITTKQSVKEAKLTGLWVGDCTTIQQGLILKFAFDPEKFTGLSTNGSLAAYENSYSKCHRKWPLARNGRLRKLAHLQNNHGK